jgi:hypothetical protein
MDSFLLKSSTIKVEISRDGFSAYLYLEPDGKGNPPVFEDILERLKNTRVTFGVNIEKIQEMLRLSQFKEKQLIASGKQPVSGQDGIVEYFVETAPKLKPKEKANGGVDHHELGYLVNVQKGQKLARLIPAQTGETGYTVTGIKISPVQVREVVLPRGVNTEFSKDDPNILIAAAGGAVRISHGKIDVLQEKVIAGDIDYSTGNLEAAGSLRIAGTVKSGFKVKALGSIDIFGNVEDAEVESDESIILHGGFVGSGKGMLRAQKDVKVKFITNQRISAGHNITIDGEAINSTLTAGNEISIEGTGILAGGIAYAPKRLRASVLGSETEISTEVVIGANQQLLEESQILNLSVKEKTEKADKLKVEIFERVKQHVDSKAEETPEFLGEMATLKDRQRQLKTELDSIQKQLQTMKDEAVKFKDAKVEVLGKIFGGVTIRCGAVSKTFKDLTRGGTVSVQDEKLVIN